MGAFERTPASIPPSIPLPLTARIPGQSMQTDDFFFCVYFSQILTQIFLLQGLAEILTLVPLVAVFKRILIRYLRSSSAVD